MSESEHRAVIAARAAHANGDQVFQHALTLVGGQIPSKRETITMQTEDPNVVLNAVAAEGWELVTADLHRQPANPEIMGMVYVWRRR